MFSMSKTTIPFLLLIIFALLLASCSYKSLSHDNIIDSTTIDSTLVSLENQLLAAVQRSSSIEDDNDNDNDDNNGNTLSTRRTTIAALRSEMVSNYRALAIAYSGSNHYEADAFSELSLRAAKHLEDKQTALEKKQHYLEHTILPNGHQYNPKLLSDLARTHHQLGHLEESEIFYERSVNVDGLAHNNLANLLTESRQWKRASKNFRAAIDRKTNSYCITRDGWDWVDNENETTQHIHVQTLSPLTNGREEDKRSFVVTMTNVSITGTSGVMFRTFVQLAHTCEIYLGGHTYMHHFRYERLRNPFVSGHLQELIREPLYEGAKEGDVVLNLLQGWQNNYYHALVEMGSRMAILLHHVLMDTNNTNNTNNTKNTTRQGRQVFKILIHKRTAIVDRVLSIFDKVLDPSTTTYIEYVPVMGVQYDVRTLVWVDWDELPSSASIMSKFPANKFSPSSLALDYLQRSMELNFLQDQQRQQQQQQQQQQQEEAHQKILVISRQGSKRGEIFGEEMLFHGLVATLMPILSILSFDQPQTPEHEYAIELFVGHQLTMIEQAAMFRKTVGVIGAHGAGLSNIIFARPGTVIVEIPLSPFEEGPYFQTIAKSLKLCYVETGSTLNISFRYVDNVLILNERKIEQLADVLQSGVEAVQNGQGCPF